MRRMSLICNIKIERLLNNSHMQRLSNLFFYSILIISTNVLSQNPGNVSSGNCTSWFKTTEATSLYSNTAGTVPSVIDGDLVGYWDNLVANPSIDAVTNLITAPGNVVLKTNDPYMNFNPTIEFTNGSLMKRELGRDDAFNITDGALVYGVYKNTNGGRDKVFTYTYISGGNGSCGSNRCCTGFRGTRSEIGNEDLIWPATPVPGANRANLIGLNGMFGTSHFNNTNGNYTTGAASGNPSASGMYSYNIGNFPGYDYTGSIAEVFTFAKGTVTALETSRIESYLAVKYGITLGVNGVSKNYINSSNAVVWNSSTDIAYNTDVAGISRDDDYQLAQLISHSVNLTGATTEFHDIMTMANGVDFSAPSAIAVNNSYAMWGNNNASVDCSTDEIGNVLSGETILERMNREWFVQESGTIGTVTIEMDMSSSNLGVWGMSNYSLLLDQDGDFTNGATAISPSNIDVASNTIYFTVDITAATGYYVTVAVLEFDINITGNAAICLGQSTDITINFSDFNGLLNLQYTDGTTTTNLIGVADGDVVTVTPTTTTTYTFSLGTSQFCGEFSENIVITIFPQPVIDLGPDVNTCEGVSVTLDALNPGSSYLWNDGSSNQTLDVTTTGTYFVAVTNSDNCVGSDTIEFYFETPPNAGLDNQNTWCITTANTDLNALIDATATTGGDWFDHSNTMNGNLNTNGQLSFNGIVGTHQADYVIYGVFCPNDTSTFALTIHEQPASLPTTSIDRCNTTGTQVDLNPYVTGSFIANPPFWEETSVAPSNQFNAAQGIIDLSLLPAGTYAFGYVLPAENPCINDTSFVEIVITENPIIQISSNVVSGCLPLEVDFINESIATNMTSVVWDFGDEQQATDVFTTTHLFESVDCFDISLTVTSDNLCTSTQTFQSLICVDPLPVADFSYSPQQIFTIDPTVDFINESLYNDYNEWHFGDETTSSLVNPSHDYELGVEGEYSVQLIVTTAAGCVDSITKVITITEELLVFVPNSFTPDGDQFNNTFLANINSGFDNSTFHMEIFNRWGESIFESRDIEFGWDGTAKGYSAEVGTYIWVLDFKSLNDDNKYVFKGHVNLIR